jgi:hypothetical protein
VAKVKKRVVRLLILKRATHPTAAKRIFVSGFLPAACYGSEILGFSNQELLKMRRLASHALQPRGQGRSLTAVLAVHGDPVAKAMLAPIVRWAREVWQVSCGKKGAGFSLPRLRRCWEIVQRKEATLSWSSIRGPVGACLLTIKRLGWKANSAFTITNDQGSQFSLTKISPSGLEKELLAGHQRQLAANTVRL